MKSIFKHTKAALIALLAMLMSITMVFGLAACNDTTNNGDDEDTTVITKYDATFDASITMGGAGPQSFAGVFSDAYVTSENGDYTLTIIFKAAPLTVMGLTGTVFIDDAPENPKDNDGTIGWYKKDGTLVTDGITVTYSSGENYAATPSQKNVYYVQSIAFKVDELRSAYDLTLYFNSNMMGMQFAKDSYKATLNLDLTSGEKVTTITGLGVATRGEAPNKETPAEEKYVKYGATLDAIISMGQNVNFTENLFDGAYAIKKDDKYEITLAFKSGVVNMPFGNTMDGFLTNSECPGYRGGDPFMPVWGYYNGETLVTDGVILTYSSDNDFVTVSAGSYYYVKSMTFTVDELEEEYILSLCVMAGNETSTSGQQFPYTANSGTVCNAVLALDLDEKETVEGIDNVLGVDTLGEVAAQPVEPAENKYTKYDAELNAIISMGQNVNFTENLFDGVYVTKKNNKYEITLAFKSGVVNMPFGTTMDGFLTNSECPGYRGGNPFMPVWGYYNDETLVTEGITLTYSSGDDYVTVSEGSYYYVKSMTFTVDALEEEYILSLCVMAGNETSTSGQQFPYTSSSGAVCNAVLSIDLTKAEKVDNIDDILGAETLGEVSRVREYQVPIASLTSAAPLPAVQQAFAKAFGDYVTLIIEEDGSMKIRVQNQHMQIDMSSMGLGTFDANVAWVQGATVITTKEEVFSNVNGNLMAEPTQETITVPDVFEIAYSPDCNGVIELTIGVDFMAKMNNKEIEEYSTKITLTLDLSSLDLEELN